MGLNFNSLLIEFYFFSRLNSSSQCTECYALQPPRLQSASFSTVAADPKILSGRSGRARHQFFLTLYCTTSLKTHYLLAPPTEMSIPFLFQDVIGNDLLATGMDVKSCTSPSEFIRLKILQYIPSKLPPPRQNLLSKWQNPGHTGIPNFRRKVLRIFRGMLQMKSECDYSLGWKSHSDSSG